MNSKRIFIDISLFNLCIVALLGFTLRSKILFSLPFINFNYISETHGHFAFNGWANVALLALMVNDILPPPLNSKPIYRWLLALIVISGWAMIYTFIAGGNSTASNLFSTFYIVITYIFGWRFITDILKTNLSRTVKLLSVSALISLALASVGTFTLAYLFATLSLNALLYRDALFTYLHFQYNGFFTLAVFALLFHYIETRVPNETARKRMYRFSVLLSLSILPSLFLSYLWQVPYITLRIIAIGGSISVLLVFTWFIMAFLAFRKINEMLHPMVRFIIVLSLSAFAIKTFLQCFTIFPAVGDAVFGNRPVIIGFLHLVFLAFVSLFLLAYYAQTGLLNSRRIVTKMALTVFPIAVVLNETVLMLQGAGTMFFTNSYLYSWFLWGISIMLLLGALLIAFSRYKYSSNPVSEPK